MEIKVKIEEGFCDYTNQQGNAFVKLVKGDEETGWLGFNALEKAHAVLRSVSDSVGVRAIPAVESSPRFEKQLLVEKEEKIDEPSLLRERVTQEEPQVTEDLDDIPGVSTKGLDEKIEYGQSTVKSSPEAKKKDAPLMAILREDLLEMQERYSNANTEDGKKPGIPEVHIREMVARYLGRFQSKNNLFQVLNTTIGMTKERFDVLSSTQKQMHGYKTFLERNRE